MTQQPLPPTQGNILETLQKRGHLTATNVAVIQKFALRWSVSHYTAILETNVLSEGTLAEAIADCWAMPRLHQLRLLHIAHSTLERIPYQHAREIICLPIGPHAATGRFAVVMADPTRADLIQRVKHLVGEELTLAVAERTDIVGTVDEFYPLSSRLPTIWDGSRSPALG
jgi:hypothetical protein